MFEINDSKLNSISYFQDYHPCVNTFKNWKDITIHLTQSWKETGYLLHYLIKLKSKYIYI